MAGLERLSVLAVVALLVLPAPVAILWGTEAPASEAQGRIPPEVSPFPAFPAASHLRVVSVPSGTNVSTRLTLVSLQGLANRDRAEVYLDFSDELNDSDSILRFVLQEYNLTYEVLDIEAALSQYLPGRAGLVVYDPSRPESTNIATMYAAIHDAALAGPDTAAALSRAHGLPILLDYATSDWPRRDAIGAYDRALAELYPSCTDRLLSIYAPDWVVTRDYLIAARVFVFYHAQGALASPSEVQATARILHATPRGIPVLGWFHSPTLTEENAFVQLASGEGKALVGAQEVPNLSVLTSLGRGNPWRQPPAASGPLALEDKTYAVVAIPDGDNVGYVAGRMRQLWRQPERGTFPIAWTISPVLAELAPPLLAYFGSSATPTDRFVAPPSGAGYLYPDYLGPGDLAPYLASSRRYLEATGLEVVWLLNAFPAHEVRYRSETLSAYVDALGPMGIVLDYADQPKTGDDWMQSGGTRHAPVTRSTHLWTTRENFLAKVDAARVARGDGPDFLWITVYPYTYDLSDATEVLDTLDARLGGRLELVTPERFFGLLQANFVREAREDVAGVRADPLASTIFSGFSASAERHLRAAEAALAAGNASVAAREAFLASEDTRAARLGAAVFVALVLLVVAAVALLRFRTPARPFARGMTPTVRAMFLLTPVVGVFFLSLRSAVDANFWTYPAVFAGLALAWLGVPLRSYVDRAHPRRASFVASLLFGLFAGLSLITNAAFPLAAIGAVLAIDPSVLRTDAGPRALSASFAIGAALGFLPDPGIVALAALATPLLLVSAFLPPATDRTPEPRVRGWFAGVALALPVAGLAPASSYSIALRLGLQDDLLRLAAVLVTVLGATLGLTLAALLKTMRANRLSLAAYSAGAVAGTSLLFVRETMPTMILLVAFVALLVVGAIASLRWFAERGGSLRRAVPATLGVATILLLLFRIPPVAYSLTLAPLPELVESAMYAPAVPATLLAAMCAVLIALRIGWTSMGKHYSSGDDGGVRRSG